MITFAEFKNRSAPGDGVHFGADGWTVAHAPEAGCAVPKMHAIRACGLLDPATDPSTMAN
jgi:hypothetical protein